METAGSLRLLMKWAHFSSLAVKTRSGFRPTTRRRRPWATGGRSPRDDRERKFATVPGIGETMHAKIVQLATTGQLPLYDEASPEDTARVGGSPSHSRLGPKEDQGALRDAQDRESGRPSRGRRGRSDRQAQGLWRKTEAKILEGIAFVETAGERILQNDALRLVAPIVDAVRQHPRVIRARSAVAAPTRQTIGDLDILFSSQDPPAVLEAFVKLPQVATVLRRTDQGKHPPGGRRSMRSAGRQRRPVPFALHYFTGSKAHNIVMRARFGAGSRSMSMR